MANIDQALIVFAAVSPDFNQDILDRFIVLAEQQKLNIVICINKTDIDIDGNYNDICKLYSDAGFDVVPISAEKGIGIDEIKKRLKGKISVLAGPSGVGKSSLLNAVNPNIKAQVGEISKKIERGRHTTRSGINPDEVVLYFREFEPYLNDCKYNGCKHLNEDSRFCGVKAQVGKNINESRYIRYKDIYNEIIEERKR